MSDVANPQAEWRSAGMDDDDYEWTPRPPNRIERIVAAVLLVALMIPSASCAAGWRFFGDYDEAVAAGAIAVGMVVFVRFMPMARRH